MLSLLCSQGFFHFMAICQDDKNNLAERFFSPIFSTANQMIHLMIRNSSSLWKSIALAWKHGASWLYLVRFVFFLPLTHVLFAYQITYEYMWVISSVFGFWEWVYFTSKTPVGSVNTTNIFLRMNLESLCNQLVKSTNIYWPQAQFSFCGSLDILCISWELLLNWILLLLNKNISIWLGNTETIWMVRESAQTFLS